MATGSSRFRISLVDETSGPSRAAAASLERLRSRITASTSQLARMQAAMKRLQSASSVDVATFRRLQSAIDAQKSSIAQLESEYVSLGGTFGNVTRRASPLTRLFEEIQGARGPVGAVAGSVASLANPLGVVVGIAAGGIAIFTAFAAAVVSGAVALSRLALASADARRSEMLHLEGLTTLRSMYGVAAGRASDLVAAIDRVSDASALSRGEVSGMAESLYRAGLRGANLSDALAGLSIAQSVQGDRGAARFRAMAVSIARTGGSVRRLADDYRARLGGIATRQAMGLDRQMERLRENIGRIFGDVRIEGFLSGMHDVLNVFSQTTASGRALHTLAGAIFSPLFDSVGRGSPVVVRLFQTLVLGALRGTNAVLRLRNQLRHTLSGDGLDGARIGAAIGARLPGILNQLNVGMWEGIASLRDAIIPALQQVNNAMWSTLFAAAGSAFSGISDTFSTIGGRMVDGLVGGIRSGLDRVRSAVQGLATSATSALENALMIRSPSRVFADLGRQIPRGLSRGIDDDANDVARSTESMAGSSVDSAATPLARSATRASASITFGDINVTVNGPADAREIATSIREQVAAMFEGMSIEIGGAT